MRAILVLFASLVVGCASRYRVEHVGTGHAVVTTRSAPAPAATAGMPLPRGAYDLAIWFHVPRAQVVSWRVSCPGVEREGEVGETYEAYRERRLAELRAQVERDRARAQTVTNIVVGAAARTSARVGPVVVEGRVEHEPGVAVVDEPPVVVELPPGDVGQGTIPTQLRVTTSADGPCTVTAIADDPNVSATYQVTRIRDLRQEERERATAIHAGAVDVRTRVRGQLVAFGADEHARQRRLEAEARARAEAEAHAARLRMEAEARAGREALRQREAELRLREEADARHRQQLAIDARLRAETEARRRLRIDAELRVQQHAEAHREYLIGWLVGTCHADPHRRERLEQERRARLEAERRERLRIQLELERRLEIAITHREYVVEWLTGTCNADPHRRAQLAEERRERERLIALRIEEERRERSRIQLERERRVALELEAERAERARLRAEAERQEQLRLDHALQVRTQVTGYLVSMGAKLRPPRPAPRHEDPGAPPFDGARWIAGTWEWTGGDWLWRAGGWTDPDRFGNAGRAGGEVVVRTVETEPVYAPPSIGVDATLVAPPPTTTVIIRRDPPRPVIRVEHDGPRRRPVIRDRNPPRSRPVIRDHRDAPRTRPTVRDHRDGSRRRPAARDRGTVRDHRR